MMGRQEPQDLKDHRASLVHPVQVSQDQRDSQVLQELTAPRALQDPRELTVSRELAEHQGLRAPQGRWAVLEPRVNRVIPELPEPQELTVSLVSQDQLVYRELTELMDNQDQLVLQDLKGTKVSLEPLVLQAILVLRGSLVLMEIQGHPVYQEKEDLQPDQDQVESQDQLVPWVL